jgi:thiamine-monophosphate kinase
LLHQRFELSAGLDVSDGLSLDLARLAEESGCGAELELAAIPVSADAERLSQRNGDGLSPLDHALGDGEDFELILAATPTEAERLVREQPIPVPIRRIGQFVAERGLWSISSGGERRPLIPRGYEHKLT